MIVVKRVVGMEGNLGRSRCLMFVCRKPGQKLKKGKCETSPEEDKSPMCGREDLPPESIHNYFLRLVYPSSQFSRSNKKMSARRRNNSASSLESAPDRRRRASPSTVSFQLPSFHTPRAPTNPSRICQRISRNQDISNGRHPNEQRNLCRTPDS